MKKLRLLLGMILYLIIVSDIFSQTTQFNLNAYKQFLEQNQDLNSSQLLNLYPA